MRSLSTLILLTFLLSSCQLSRPNDLSRAQSISSGKLKRTHQSRILTELIGNVVSELTGLPSVASVSLANITMINLNNINEEEIKDMVKIERLLYEELQRYKIELEAVRSEYFEYKTIVKNLQMQKHDRQKELQKLITFFNQDVSDIQQKISKLKQKAHTEKISHKARDKFLQSIEVYESQLKALVNGVHIEL